jgi:diacylglycerol kinase family enzyme
MEILRADDFKIHCSQPIDIQADGEIFRTKGEIEISTLPHALKVIINPNFRYWMS